MELNTQEELKAHLMDSSEEFQALVKQHQDYDRRLEDLEAMSHLSEDEQMEEVWLKKMKLHTKDQLNEFLHKHTPTFAS